jgi:hypothetical protein
LSVLPSICTTPHARPARTVNMVALLGAAECSERAVAGLRAPSPASRQRT